MIYTLTETEKQLLEIIQSNFPLIARPYRAIGQAIGITEEDVLALLQSLKDRQILRQISAIFYASKLGFSSTLVSFQVPESRLEHAAHVINCHPGVSHNYRRVHRFNIWFTLSVPETSDIKRHVHTLAELTTCRNYLALPCVNMFKRRVQLVLAENRRDVPAAPLQTSDDWSGLSRKMSLPPDNQRQLMNALQQDLALIPRPFQQIAEQFHLSSDEMFSFLKDLKQSKTMSRFAGILKHRNLGFTSNAMVVWKITPHQIRPFVEKAVAYQTISHCYERLTYPEWPYNLYTMIHGKTRHATQKIIDELSSQGTVDDYEILYSDKEYKKQRVNYFSREIYDWEQQHGITSG